ncbi:hypothetical protein CMK14_11380 [Candidatus Poribacteria bacterium]|nr:hypothetical protein [Candidatus Poribacteria bacterium]
MFRKIGLLGLLSVVIYIGLFVLGTNFLQILVILGILGALAIGFLRPVKSLIDLVWRKMRS